MVLWHLMFLMFHRRFFRSVFWLLGILNHLNLLRSLTFGKVEIVSETLH